MGTGNFIESRSNNEGHTNPLDIGNVFSMGSTDLIEIGGAFYTLANSYGCKLEDTKIPGAMKIETHTGGSGDIGRYYVYHYTYVLNINNTKIKSLQCTVSASDIKQIYYYYRVSVDVSKSKVVIIKSDGTKRIEGVSQLINLEPNDTMAVIFVYYVRERTQQAEITNPKYININIQAQMEGVS